MDTPQSVTNMEIKDSVMPLKATQPRGLIQNKRDDDDTMQVGANTNLDCSDNDKDLAVTCDDIPFGERCHGDDSDILDSVRHDKTDGWKKISACAWDNDDPCGQAITGGVVFNEKDMDGTEDSRGPGKKRQEVDKDKKPRHKEHRASLYTFQHKDGTFYHVRMESELGEEYRKLATKAEKKAFILANGFPKGNLYEARARGKVRREEKRLEEESREEIPEVDPVRLTISVFYLEG
ncbi:unnamed protein product [Clonostachys solani]|uniref:Uncharacterized protein n=1 Tax=Clonostachys solani TaxID=160281 RepID=A0A9P0ERN3_9HYPO|nr:unnamed protein product [Clonostachys solani]